MLYYLDDKDFRYHNEGDCEIKSARSSAKFLTDPSPEDNQGERWNTKKLWEYTPVEFENHFWGVNNISR